MTDTIIYIRESNSIVEINRYADNKDTKYSYKLDTDLVIEGRDFNTAEEAVDAVISILVTDRLST